MAILETQAAFARRRGVSKAAVAKWKAGGLLSMTAEGLVEVEESEWRLEARPGTYRGGKTKAQKTAEAAELATPPIIQSGESAEDAAERIVIETGAPHSHAEAVRIKENYQSPLRHSRLRKQRQINQLRRPRPASAGPSVCDRTAA